MSEDAPLDEVALALWTCCLTVRFAETWSDVVLGADGLLDLSDFPHPQVAKMARDARADAYAAIARGSLRRPGAA